MIVVTGNKNNELFRIGSILDYWDNGYPVIRNDTNDVGIAYIPEQVTIHKEVDSVPDGIEPYKYCYTEEKGFYLNPNWEEPNQYGISKTLLEEIQADTMQQLQAEISGAEPATAMPAPAFVRAVRAMTLTADDQTAARAVELYPVWQPDIEVETGDRLQYEGKLYKVRQDHTTQAGKEPSIHTAALYDVINVENAGTIDDPIPYDGNMELFEGKYYTSDGVLYLCFRSTGQPVYQPAEALVDIYLKVV